MAMPDRRAGRGMGIALYLAPVPIPATTTKYLIETGWSPPLPATGLVCSLRSCLREGSIRLAGELPGGFWDDYARQLARSPDMTGGLQIRGLIHRAALHADRVGRTDPFVPHA